MTRYSKTSTGKYQIKGSTYPKLVGSRAQVWHGNAYKTTGDLTKLNLFKNKSGRVVSRKKHITASKEKRLVKHGYGARKGKFGAVRLNTKRRRKRGGYSMGVLSPAPVSGMADDSMSTDALQLEAGMSGGRRRRRRSSKRRSSKRSRGRRSSKRRGGRRTRRRRSSRRRSKRGGMSALNPASVSGMYNDEMSNVDLQSEAGMSGGRRRKRRRSSKRRSSKRRSSKRRSSRRRSRKGGKRRRRRSSKRRR